mmetsp:Transcript_35896/g.55106  ORF Transcript_35896/g.55106 Transcript_35896/m.55106 type:complete len:128 (+) Transcript_35896:1363-1746(+)
MTTNQLRLQLRKISNQADLLSLFDDKFFRIKATQLLLTVIMLVNQNSGAIFDYDLAFEQECRILKEESFSFHWLMVILLIAHAFSAGIYLKWFRARAQLNSTNFIISEALYILVSIFVGLVGLLDSC